MELDTSPPEIQNLTLVSDNSEDTLIQAREDDNITLRFDSWKNCRCPKSPCRVILLKSWISVPGQGPPGKRSIRSSLEILEKSATIDYKDLASNEGIQKTGDDLSNKMVIDTQLPNVLNTGISIQSSNTIAAVDGLKWARKDENIKLIFNTSEHVFSPKVNIAGVEVNAFPRDSDTTGTQWEATYRVENILGDLLESTNLVLRLDASNIDGNRNRASPREIRFPTGWISVPKDIPSTDPITCDQPFPQQE